MRSFFVPGIAIIRFLGTFLFFTFVYQNLFVPAGILLAGLFFLDIRAYFYARTPLRVMQHIHLQLSESLFFIGAFSALYATGSIAQWSAYGFLVRDVFVFVFFLVTLFLFRRLPHALFPVSPVDVVLRLVQYAAVFGALIRMSQVVLAVFALVIFLLSIGSCGRLVWLGFFQSHEPLKTR